MADTVTKRWIYPPNWDVVYGESFPGESAADRSDGFQHKGFNSYKLKLTNKSDGTGESKVKKVDISNLRDASGRIAVRTVIKEIKFSNYGMGVELYWEGDATDELIAVLPQNESGTICGPIIDSRIGDGTDGSGDILLSTIAAASNDTYDIELCIKAKGKERIVPPSDRRGW